MLGAHRLDLVCDEAGGAGHTGALLLESRAVGVQGADCLGGEPGGIDAVAEAGHVDCGQQNTGVYVTHKVRRR